MKVEVRHLYVVRLSAEDFARIQRACAQHCGAYQKKRHLTDSSRRDAVDAREWLERVSRAFEDGKRTR